MQLACPSAPDFSEEVFIGDIIAAASRGGKAVSLSWFVGEVIARIHCEPARLAHIKLLRERYAATCSGSSARVNHRATVVTFTLDCQVVVAVRISADYPRVRTMVVATVSIRLC